MKRLALACLFSLLQAPVFSLTTLEQAIAELSNGDLTAARIHAEQLVREDSSNASAWYLLGNCYVQQGNVARACDAYTTCLQCNPDSQTHDYAVQALANLAKAMTGAKGAPSSVKRPEGADEARVREQANVMLAQKERQKNDLIDRLTKQEEEEISAIPDYIYVGQGVTATAMTNPDKKPAVQAIRARYTRKIDALKEDFAKQERACDADLLQRLNALREHQANSSLASKDMPSEEHSGAVPSAPFVQTYGTVTKSRSKN